MTQHHSPTGGLSGSHCLELRNTCGVLVPASTCPRTQAVISDMSDLRLARIDMLGGPMNIATKCSLCGPITPEGLGTTCAPALERGIVTAGRASCLANQRA